jgi:hypothetical protein
MPQVASIWERPVRISHCRPRCRRREEARKVAGNEEGAPVLSESFPYTECPACGREIEIRQNDPHFFEARFRAKGGAHATGAGDAAKIPGRCEVCGGLLSRSGRGEARGPRVPAVLPADEPGRAAAPAGADALPGKPAGAGTFFGLGLLGWGLLAGGFCALVLCLLVGGVAVLALVHRPHHAAAPQHGTPPPATQFPGLLGYWALDEGQGDRAADSSGNGPGATVVNGRWAEGVRGKALHLSGAGSYLDYGDSPRLSFAARAPFTLAFWVRTGRARGTLLSQRHHAEGGPVIDVLLDAGHVTAQVRQDGNDFAAPLTLKGGRVGDSAWHHVALTRNGDTLELFLDGASQGLARGGAGGGAITTDWRALGAERYWAARHAAFGDPTFEGDLDELCIFGRALRPGEVRALAGR